MFSSVISTSKIFLFVTLNINAEARGVDVPWTTDIEASKRSCLLIGMLRQN